jgi:hypothetical protein
LSKLQVTGEEQNNLLYLRAVLLKNGMKHFLNFMSIYKIYSFLLALEIIGARSYQCGGK